MTQPGEDLHYLDVLFVDGSGPDTDASTEPAAVPADLRLPFDANEAGVYEQSQVVELDDEY